MTLFSLAALTNALASFSLGVIVFTLNSKTQLNRIFAALASIITFANLAIFLTSVAPTIGNALFWSRCAIGMASLIQLLQFNFILVFTNVSLRKNFLSATYLFFAICLALSFSPFFILAVSPHPTTGYWPKPGVIYQPLVVGWFGYLLYGIYLLYRHSLRVSKQVIERQQVLYVFAAMVIGSLSGVTNVLLSYRVPYAELGNFSVAFAVILLAYTAVKHGALTQPKIGSRQWSFLQFLIATITLYLLVLLFLFFI